MKAICAGTYDPITYGHLDIIRRAANMYETVHVAVVDLPAHKKPLFTVDERIEMIRTSLEDIAPQIEIAPFSTLLVDYARSIDAGVIVRGLRAVSDYEYEMQINQINRTQAPEIETVFLLAKSEYSFISSSAVRELARFHGDLTAYVPEHIETIMKEKYL